MMESFLQICSYTPANRRSGSFEILDNMCYSIKHTFDSSKAGSICCRYGTGRSISYRGDI